MFRCRGASGREVLGSEKLSSKIAGFVSEGKYEDQFYNVIYLVMQYLLSLSAKWSTERFGCYCEYYHSYCLSER